MAAYQELRCLALIRSTQIESTQPMSLGQWPLAAAFLADLLSAPPAAAIPKPT